MKGLHTPGTAVNGRVDLPVSHRLGGSAAIQRRESSRQPAGTARRAVLVSALLRLFTIDAISHPYDYGLQAWVAADLAAEPWGRARVAAIAVLVSRLVR